MVHMDRNWFLEVNNHWQNGLFDLLCPFMRNQSNWYLLYAVIIYFLFQRFGKKTWWLLLAATISIFVSDQLSGNLIKHAVERLRPCNDPELKASVRLLVTCGNGFSFVSSHASNHFTAALFFGAVFGKDIRWVWPASLCWAGLISFSQVYVGVHFPLDVICGAALGIAIGTMSLFIIRNHIIGPNKDLSLS